MRSAAAALLEGLIDYAGLFPPAALAMRDAVAAYDAHRLGPGVRALGRFVVPAGRLAELARTLAARAPAPAAAWPVSVILADAAADAAAIDAVDSSPEGALLRVEAAEVRVDGPDAVEAAAAHIAPPRERWFEVQPGAALGSTLEAIRRVEGGAKLRTGGVTASQIPEPAAVAVTLLACARAGVPFKATAGLHHALRGRHRLTGADDSPRALMHGYLNVFLGAALARQLVRRGYPDPEAHADVVALLEETDPDAFAWTRDGVAWRGHGLDAAALSEARAQFARSFGSCSFDEPLAEARALGLLADPAAGARTGADPR